MKAFWDNLFYDMAECGLDKEEFAKKAGSDICEDLCRIEDAIREHDGKRALTLIAEFKNWY